MRILILTNLFPPHVLGGYEVACCAVSLGLRQRGHEVEVLASHAPVPTDDDPPWLYRDFSLRAFSPIEPRTVEQLNDRNYACGASQFSNTATLIAHLRRFRPDVVYVWNLYGIGGLALLDLLDVVGFPRVVHLMDNVPGCLLHGVPPIVASLLCRRSLGLVSRGRTIAMSEHLLTEVAETTGVRHDPPADIVPGWVDTTGLGRRAHYLEGGKLRMVAAGALGAHKGTDIVIDACERLVALGHKDFMVDLYGFGNATPYVARAAERGVSKHVRFMGLRSQAEILALLPDYDAFVFPTWEREPFGLAPLEAAACGVVPILTRNAGVCERLVDEVHALKIERSAEALAAAAARLISGEADAAAIGRRAAALVRQDLTLAAWLPQIERILAEAAHPWDARRLDDPRVVTLVYAKHALGEHLLARQ